MNKSELRTYIKQQKRSFSRQQLEEWSLDIITRLKQEPHFQQAQTVLLYYALPDEVDTRDLLAALNDKTVLLPRVIDDENMEIRYYQGAEDLQAGAFGIMEPCGQRFTDYEKIDVAVIPGMAFDRQGNRLGRGRGYYDRFLSRVPYIYKIGLCFPFQLTDKVPAEDNDICMDVVIS